MLISFEQLLAERHTARRASFVSHMQLGLQHSISARQTHSQVVLVKIVRALEIVRPLAFRVLRHATISVQWFCIVSIACIYVHLLERFVRRCYAIR